MRDMVEGHVICEQTRVLKLQVAHLARCASVGLYVPVVGLHVFCELLIGREGGGAN